jgi:hypothetical protein
MEDVANYLISHPEFIERAKARKRGKVICVMFDEETERLAAAAGLKIALPPSKLRDRLDFKIETTRIGNEAGVASVPNAIGRANTYGTLSELAQKAGLGGDLVVQTPLRRQRANDLLRQLRGRLEQVRVQDRRPGPQGDEAHQSPSRHCRRLRDAARNAGRTGDDRHHRLRRDHAI